MQVRVCGRRWWHPPLAPRTCGCVAAARWSHESALGTRAVTPPQIRRPQSRLRRNAGVQLALVRALRCAAVLTRGLGRHPSLRVGDACNCTPPSRSAANRSSLR